MTITITFFSDNPVSHEIPFGIENWETVELLYNGSFWHITAMHHNADDGIIEYTAEVL